MPLTRTGCDRVIVVDDDPTVAHVVSRYLRTAGFAVEVMADGQRALAPSAPTRRPWSCST